MTIPHLLNLGVHIGVGIVGMALGAAQLVLGKAGERHRRRGRWFMWAALLVTGSAFIGLVAFRFLPLFAVLTLLVTYVSVSGWRVARTRSAGPQGIDLAWTVLAAAAATALVPILIEAPHVGSSRPVVVWSALGALAFVLAYDGARWTFPRAWFQRLWLPEHIYKVVSALSGMVSAFVGNVVEWGQPWSQVAPSALGLFLIAYFMTQAATLKWRYE
ncbi:MAG: hypothetical protein U0Q55_18130 [Vicinamibacterales bacterium]